MLRKKYKKEKDALVHDLVNKGRKTAEKVGAAMENIYKSMNLDYQLYLSEINPKGIKVLKRL